MATSTTKFRVGIVTISLTKKAYTPWKLLVRGSGGRKREFRSTREAAEERASELNKEIRNFGLQGAALTATERAESLAIRDLLRPYPSARPVEIVRDWVKRQTELSPRFKSSLETFLLIQESRRLRQRTMGNLRNRLTALSTSLGDIPIRDITGEILQGWLDGEKRSAVSKVNYKRAFNPFFEFALKRKWIDRNPCRDVDLPRVSKSEPSFLNLDDAARTLKYASDHPELDLLAYFVLQLFAGLRPEEIARIDDPTTNARGLAWSDINFEKRSINIPAEVSKIGERRYLEGLPENIWVWLEIAKTQPQNRAEIAGGGNGTKATGFRPRAKRGYCKNGHKSGRIAPSGINRRLAIFRTWRIKEKVNYCPDAGRHSFATYHVAAFQNPAKTALLLGHHGQQMLYEHYRGIATKEQGDAYFGILPSLT